MGSLSEPARGRVKDVGGAFRALLERTARRVEGGTRSAATLAMQRQHVEFLLERIPATTPVVKLTPARIARLLEEEGQGRRKGRKLSGSSLRKRACTLSQALELVRGKAPKLPEIPHRYTPRPKFLAYFDDYERLRDSLTLEQRLWFVLAIWTGQRRSDVERMVREDFDAVAQVVTIRSTKTHRAGIRIHAADELVRELAQHWRGLCIGEKLVPAWPSVNEVLRARCADLGLPHLSAHSLRHTFFTWFVQANGITPELLAIGGWKGLQVPVRVYAHALPVQFGAQIDRTVALARTLHRAPQGSAKAEAGTTAAADGDQGGAASAATLAAPATSPEGTLEAGSDHKPGNGPVSAEGIEPSTNGLRVRFVSLQPRSPRGALPTEGPPWPQQPHRQAR